MYIKGTIRDIIKKRFDDEKEKIEIEPETIRKFNLSIVRPVFFSVFLTVTLVALAISIITAIKFFLKIG